MAQKVESVGGFSRTMFFVTILSGSISGYLVYWAYQLSLQSYNRSIWPLEYQFMPSHVQVMRTFLRYASLHMSEFFFDGDSWHFQHSILHHYLH